MDYAFETGTGLFEASSSPAGIQNEHVMKTIFFCVGYVATWFFAGVALEVATFIAN